MPRNPAALPFEMSWSGVRAEVEFDGARAGFGSAGTVAAWCAAAVAGLVRLERRPSGGFRLAGTAAGGEPLDYRSGWGPVVRRSRLDVREWEAYDVPVPEEDR